jgi:acyl-CoA synthetase (AMP-forming)/AMP-acid ligase II
VVDAVVVGAPDPRWGERVVAVVQPRAPGAIDVARLRSHCAGRLAGYKIPRAVVCVEAVRRSPAGKADYRWAREAAREALVPAEP